MIIDYFLLAFQNLSRRRLRSWLTMIGIFIGIAAVVSLISLGSGLKESITGQFAGLGTDKITIQASGTNFGPPGSTALTRLTEDDMEAIDKVKGVENVIPRLVRMVPVKSGKITVYNFAASLPDDPELKKLALAVLNVDIGKGRMLEKKDKYKVVLGSDYSEKKVLGKKLLVGDNIEVSEQNFEVIGFLERSGSIFGNGFILMNHDVMKEVVNSKDELDLIVAQIGPTTSIDEVSEDINKLLRKRRDVDRGEEDFSVSTPQATIESLNSILNAVQWFLVMIAGISLLVGGVGITNTMYTAVLERRKEIGIMKSIGATNSSVLSIFMIESGLLGMVGGIIGIFLGVLLGLGVQFIAAQTMGPGFIKNDFSLILIFGALIFSFGVGVLSGILPAFQASKLNPVDALRK